MTRSLARITPLPLIALALGACSDSDTEVESAPAATETVSATPTPSTESVEKEEDEWLQEAREDHLHALGSWYREYVEADCSADEPECYDLFAEGVPLMEDYRDWLGENYDDLPEYLPLLYYQDVSGAAMSLDLWSYACPDMDDCGELATEAAEDSFEVIAEAESW